MRELAPAADEAYKRLLPAEPPVFQFKPLCRITAGNMSGV
jgi:hypothetical protein